MSFLHKASAPVKPQLPVPPGARNLLLTILAASVPRKGGGGKLCKPACSGQQCPRSGSQASPGQLYSASQSLSGPELVEEDPLGPQWGRESSWDEPESISGSSFLSSVPNIHGLVINYLATWPELCSTVNTCRAWAPGESCLVKHRPVGLPAE